MSYNYVAPVSVKPEYKPYNQVDFQVQLKANSIKANSFRLVGKMKAFVNGNTPLHEKNYVFMNPYCGASALFSSVSTSINATQTIEQISSFGRLVGMKKQSKFTLADMTASSENSIELCGSKSSKLLLGEVGNDGYISFCLKIDNCLNNMLGGDMHPAVVQEVRLMLTLDSAMNAMYVNPQEDAIAVTELDYSLRDLELHFTEVAPLPKPEPMVFETHFLTQQSMVSKISSLSVLTGSTPADKISCSFIKQRNRSQLTTDENMCEFVSDINRVEMDINSTTAVAMYPLQSYSDIAQNYWFSFKQPNATFSKNSITSKVTGSTNAFGIGFALPEAIGERLTMTVTIDDTPAQPGDDPSGPGNAIDAFVYCNAYVEM